VPNQPCIPANVQIREYQKDAMRVWFDHRGRGILEMATGSGKTVTSLCAIVKLLEQYEEVQQSCGLIIVLPYKVLLEQWSDILTSFGLTPLECYENKEKWLADYRKQIDLFNRGHLHLFVFTVTNATLYDIDFQNGLNRIYGDYIFCADEVHHLATQQGLAMLPTQATYRLGLSATLLDRGEDGYLNQIKTYFENGVIYQFSLQRAIDEEFLTPYCYHPVFVDLTDGEKEDYYQLSQKIGRMYPYRDDPGSAEMLQSLFIKRARLITSASNKLQVLRQMKDIIQEDAYTLFYCGDKIEADGRFVDKVNRVLSFDCGIKTHTFTAEENKVERQRILADFTAGNIEALTAIRCLDEGIDIPQLRRAFILSSGTNPKEFIQRRGRILRKFPGKDVANIYDFFVVPSLDKGEIRRLDNEQLHCERRILNREFQRFQEFADLAKNQQEAYSKLLDIWELYNY